MKSRTKRKSKTVAKRLVAVPVDIPAVKRHLARSRTETAAREDEHQRSAGRARLHRFRMEPL